jgi:hypothetical protein
VDFVVPKWLSLGLIVVIFVIALLYARRHGPRETAIADETAELLTKQGKS